MRAPFFWIVFAACLCVPIVLTAMSPLLAWRNWIYILAGFAGVLALTFIVLQPLLAAKVLPNLSATHQRKLHRVVGAAIASCVAVHIIGLWVTSPPDMVDALLFRAPTLFSVWGVVAMWALLATSLLAVLRGNLRVAPRIWQRTHISVAIIAIVASISHVLPVQGAMEQTSKLMICAAAFAAALMAVVKLKIWAGR